MHIQDPKLLPLVEALEQGRFEEVEQRTIQILKKVPFHEDALQLLCEAMIRQGYAPSALKVMRRTCLFHPQAPWIGDMEKRLENLSPEKGKREIDTFLDQRKGTTIAAAVLTRNASRTIQRCLASLQEAVDEVVVIDSGSTDGTVEIAQRFPKVRVFPFTWCDDFSAARNFGLTQIQSRWVFWVDADEYLHPEDPDSVREIASVLDTYEPTPLVHVSIWNLTGQTVTRSDHVPRMFPLRGNLRFFGRVHEQIGPSEGNRYTDLKTHDFLVPIRLIHDGYDAQKVDMGQKLQRNLKLLRQMLQEEPGDPTWLMFLGRELLGAGEFEEGLKFLQEAEKKARNFRGFGALLEIQRLLLQGFLTLGRFKQAEEVCTRMRETDPNFPDTYYYLAYVQMQLARDLLVRAEQNLKEGKSRFASYRGLVAPDNQIAEWKTDLLTADLLRLTGRLSQAHSLYEKLMDRCPTYQQEIEEQLRRIRREAAAIQKGTP
ncbi:hypothetical protein DNHGIG_11970 [Collibacillus ludicampi]|uniref:Glycosyltransferase 2-like domain-containing protein n=1 Tax=Collibacillus ludicampi TaxID=2771369 RepID=A0AAV4LDB3_9BACL|nr:glycosyltransferase [Collibacillus ludicampi]GIM45648.1 hypothetical protein DNHGIG_11970 [Collibacillus ludicampi]